MDEWLDEWMKPSIHQWSIDPSIDRSIRDPYIDPSMNTWMDGGVDGWMDEAIYQWSIDRSIHSFTHSPIHPSIHPMTIQRTWPHTTRAETVYGPTLRGPISFRLVKPDESQQQRFWENKTRGGHLSRGGVESLSFQKDWTFHCLFYWSLGQSFVFCCPERQRK